MMKPPISTSLPVSTCMRVEMLARRGVAIEGGSKVAVTLVGAFSVTKQGPVPAQAPPPPLQPVKTEPGRRRRRERTGTCPR